ncbi:MAG: sensor histidine kinase [Candidatus Marinimicrobia bacterium]|nr:sensor histidine kinase [Candidatus Neomarinimicrobiota bacterium]
MQKFRLNSNSIIAFSLVLVSSFVFLVIKFYQTALSEATSYHQQLQSEMAKTATASMTNYFEHLTDDLHLFSQLGLENVDVLQYSNQLGTEGISSWFTLDDNFNIEKIGGKALSQWVAEELRILSINAFDPSHGRGPESRTIFSPVYPDNLDSEDPPYHFLVIFLPERTSQPDYPLNPVVRNMGLLISFDWLMEKFVTPLKLGKDDFAWVMDNGGRLIYHPNHEEMLLHNIRDIQEDCAECHSSFKIQERMILEGSGRAKYIIEGEPEKIMAYEPIQYGGLKWVLAISTYSPSVARDVLRNSIAIFILSGVFLLLLIITGGSLYYLNIKRVLADQAKKRISEVQRIQEKLDQATKLASLGELIDSVAHEINTPTGIISAVADGMILNEDLGEDSKGEMHVIKKQVHRIKDYTRRLLGYSRVMPFRPEVNDILDLISECLFLVGPRLNAKKVVVINELPETWPSFTFDRPRLEQVIINLLNNAIDFVGSKGRVTLRIENRDEESSLGLQTWHVLSIEDNGAGIPAADIPNIFKPFVSNKPGSQGTGLGLSISKSIVERHSGRLEVQSSPGEGATFLIYLPADKS